MRRSGTSGHIATLVVTGVLTLAFFIYWLGVAGGLPGGSAYRVNAALPAASNLTPGSSVRIAGVPVGRVAVLDRSGTTVVAGLEIDDDHAPLARDARVRVRLRTLVGENYVEVMPGTSPETVPDRGFLPISRAGDYVEVDEILSALRGRTRQRARDLMQSLGGAVGGRGRELSDLVGGATTFVDTAKPIIATLERQEGEVARLVDNVGRVTAAVGDRGRELRAAASSATTSLRSVAAADAEVRTVMRQLPGTLRDLRSTSGSLSQASRRVSPVLTDLAGAITDLDPAVRALRPAAQQGREVLRAADGAAPPLTGALRSLRRTAPAATAALPALDRALCEVGPVVSHFEPYARELGAILTGLGSATNYYDATGHAARLYIIASPKSLALQDQAAASTIESLMQAGVVGRLGVRGWNPYPAPGAVNQTAVGAGLTGPGKVTTPYQRIHPRC